MSIIPVNSEISQQEKIKRGIALLAAIDDNFLSPDSEDYRYRAVEFKKSPFDGLDKKFIMLGEDGVSEPSVKTMRAFIKMLLAHNTQPQALKIFYLQTSKENCHDIYFVIENDMAMNVFCGGCNDYSGGGSLAREKLDMLFALLSFSKNIKIAEREFGFKEASVIGEVIEHSQFEFYKRNFIKKV